MRLDSSAPAPAPAPAPPGHESAARAISRLRPKNPRALLPQLSLGTDAPTVIFGCDPARFGVDANVLFARHDDWVLAGAQWHGLDNNENAELLAEVIVRWEQVGWITQWCAIDVIGIGAGVSDILWSRGPKFRQLVKPINVAKRSTQPARYKNSRAEIAWNLRRRFRDGKIHFYSRDRFPHHEGTLDAAIHSKLLKQATTILYGSDELFSGVIKLESKQQYKDRIGNDESPDEFDALALTFNDNFAGLERRPTGTAGAFRLFER
jgi:hypothetical protein